MDFVRGAAILGVVLYHLIWDLRLFQFTRHDPIFDPLWLAFAKVLLASFLLLAGVSLVLAHRDRIHWRPFWKRFGILLGAALLVTVGTYIAFPDGYVYFGILHALAVFSLIGVFFVRAPMWLVIGLGVFFIAAPFGFHSDFFNSRWTSWIGFWTVEPYTQDLVPLFPGQGFVLLGIALVRIMLSQKLGVRILGLRSKRLWYRFFEKAGRWSLIIYMVHQPILFGILTPLANWLQPGKVDVAVQAEIFQSNCLNYCVNPVDDGTPTRGADTARCLAYCSCATEQMVQNNLFAVATSAEMNAQQSAAFDAIPRLCQAMAGAGASDGGNGEGEMPAPDDSGS